MNTNKIADWAEILASLAVVVSLLFLLQEVRTNTRTVERESALVQAAALAQPFFESPEMRAVAEKVIAVDGGGSARVHEALIERYGLTYEEAVLWHRHMMQLWLGIEADYMYGDREAAVANIEMVMRYPDNQIYIEHEEFEGDFGDVVRRIANR